MHAKFLQVDGGKMAKSLGNFYTLDDVIARGFTPRDLRYTMVRGHYRQPLNFTWDIVSESRAALEKLDDLVVRLERAADGCGQATDADAGDELLSAARAKLEGGMNDDLNTPVALSALFELRSAVLSDGLGARTAAAASTFVERALDALGIARAVETDGGLEERVNALLAERTRARDRRDFAESDRIRDVLLDEGIVIEDTPAGPVWRRK
jgi:cysteinyl-tRNA synthetase